MISLLTYPPDFPSSLSQLKLKPFRRSRPTKRIPDSLLRLISATSILAKRPNREKMNLQGTSRKAGILKIRDLPRTVGYQPRRFPRWIFLKKSPPPLQFRRDGGGEPSSRLS